jgi:hypothetical protein
VKGEEDERVREPVPNPVIEVVGIGLVVPQADHHPVLIAGEIGEAARACLDLSADEQPEVEQSRPAGVDKQIGP